LFIEFAQFYQKYTFLFEQNTWLHKPYAVVPMSIW
jgi:hypothetical protein